MRSVFVYLHRATEVEVAAFLQRTYPFQMGPPWIDTIGNNPCLYINIERFEQIVTEPDEQENFVRRFGSRPSTTVMADVSGRHPGGEQVQNFLSGILTKFAGVAQDDYSRHFWTLDEICSGRLVQGHPFFDYDGWYEDGDND